MQRVPKENKKNSPTVEKVTIEESDNWLVKENKKNLFISLFSLLVSIVVLILTFYSNS